MSSKSGYFALKVSTGLIGWPLIIIGLTLCSCERNERSNANMYLDVCIESVKIVPSWIVDPYDVNSSSVVRIELVGSLSDWKEVCCGKGYSMHWVYHGEILENVDFGMRGLLDSMDAPDLGPVALDSTYFHQIRIELFDDQNIEVADSAIVITDRSELYLPMYLYDSSNHGQFWQNLSRPEVGFWLCDSKGRFLQKIVSCSDVLLIGISSDSKSLH